MWSNFESINSEALEISADFERSQLTATESSEIVFSFVSISFSSELLRARAITVAPDFAIANAIERPKPFEAPVTRKTSSMTWLGGFGL